MYSVVSIIESIPNIDTSGLLLTEQSAVDLGSSLHWEKSRPLFLSSNQCTSIKTKSGWNAVMFCACEIIQLILQCSVWLEPCINLTFRVVINETPNNWRQTWRSRRDRDSCFDRMYEYVCPHRRRECFKDSTHAVQVNCTLMSKGR